MRSLVSVPFSVVIQVIFLYFQIFNLGQATAELGDQLTNVKTDFNHLEEEVIHLVTFKLQQDI